MGRFKRRVMFIVAAVAILILSFVFSGCVKSYGNDRSWVTYCLLTETEEEYVYDVSAFTSVNQTLNINKQTGEASIVKGEIKNTGDYTEPEQQILKGNDFPTPHGEFKCRDGYEQLPELLTETYEKDDVKYIQYYAVEYGEEVYGFCNLYSNCAGYFAGGGQIANEYLIAGIYFKYDAKSGQLTEISKFNKCNIVACNTQSVVYLYKNKKYYSYTMGDESDRYICADEAYDSGMTHYSYVYVFFNEKHCIIFMHRGYSNWKKDYDKIVMCDYSGEVIGEFTFNNLY
ncbi:MAG: hypothetical protein K2N14_03275 [Clostridia bacterium]|nr:hypothetical protein [Clostridia bacterium]